MTDSTCETSVGFHMMMNNQACLQWFADQCKASCGLCGSAPTTTTTTTTTEVPCADTVGTILGEDGNFYFKKYSQLFS